MTTAFVLSGGGNRGPIEVGALQSLLEHGIRPDFIVGTSAGSINSAFLASRGADLAAIPGLAGAWRTATAAVAYPGGIPSAVWRVLRGRDSLFSSDGLRKLIEDNLPPGVTTFGDLRCPLYTTATDLRSRRLYLFGEDKAAPLVDAVLASASMPGIHPPVHYHELELVDGGIIATTPIGIAIEKGANLIYALNLGGDDTVQPPVRGLPRIFARTFDIFMLQSFFSDIDRATADRKIDLHLVTLDAFTGVAFNDFSQTEAMMAAGKEITDAYLAAPTVRALGQEETEAAAPTAPPRPLHTVPGAREYVPLYARWGS
jgi:NTE family protein